MTDINTWNATDDNNNIAAPAGWPEGMMPSGVNNSARAMMGALKRWRDQSQPTVTATGSGNAQIITYPVAPAALANGDTFAFFALANTGPATLTINAQAAKPIVTSIGTALIGGEMPAGAAIMVVYDGTSFRMLAAPTPLSVSNGGTGATTPAGAAAAIGAVPITGGTMTGPLNGTAITASGNIQGYDIIATHNLSAVNQISVNIIQGNFINSTGAIQAASTITAAGNMQCYDMFATHNLNGVNVNASGNVTGAFISSTGAIQAATTITAAGNMQCYDMFATHNFNGVNVNVSGTVTASNFVTTSDDAIKERVEPYARGLAAVAMLNPVSFEYVGGASGLPDGQRQYGLIAQHVERVIPEMVGQTVLDIGGVATSVSTLSLINLSVVLVNAIKELATRVERLEAGLTH